MTEHPVLVATDLSSSGDEAVRQGHRWATESGARLVVCHAVSTLTAGSLKRAEAEQHVAERVSELLQSSPEDFSVSLLSGSPSAAIVAEAEARKARLLTVGASQSGLLQALLGSTTDQVVRHAPCPVLVARPSPAQGPVLAATDFSDPALPAVAAAVVAAGHRETELLLLHSVHQPVSPLSLLGPAVFEPPSDASARETLHEAASDLLKTSLDRFGVQGQSIVTEGVPGKAIASAAKEHAAQLVVVGHKGRTGLAEIALGSEAYTVARAAPCSVLIIRLRHGETGMGLIGEKALELASKVKPPIASN